MQLLEGKEDAFINLLGTKLAGKGYTVSPLYYSPAIPPSAAERLAAAAQEAEANLASAAAAVAAAQFEADQYRGYAGQEGAENRLTEAKEALAAAEKVVEELKKAEEGAAEAAAVSEKLLQQYDIVFWKPKKVMTVSTQYLTALLLGLCICWGWELAAQWTVVCWRGAAPQERLKQYPP